MLRSIALATAATCATATAQGLLPSYVTDSAGDTIWACNDLNQDGDYNDVGEATVFYDDVAGAQNLTNNAGLLRSPDGAVWVSDTSEDFVLRLEDQNGDGDALDAGEATVWFDGTAGNPTGVELTSGRGMWRDPDGTFWVASANTGGGGNDAIVRLEDVNGDGDANDAGEQSEYLVLAPGGATGDSIPTAISRGADGALYYVETGSTGVVAKGVWRLEDLNGSGDIDQPSEATLFFDPPALAVDGFHWDLGQDGMGRFYLNDTSNDVIWRFRDIDGDGVVNPGTEAEQIFAPTSSSLIWEITPAPDGSLYLAEDQNPDRLLRLVDMDGDGLFQSAGEVIEIYDETLAATNIGSPKGIALIDTNTDIGMGECSPANANSTGFPAQISATGSTSAGLNSALLTAASLPSNSFGFFIVAEDAGFVPNAGGSQGNLCLSGPIGRYVNAIFNSGPAGEATLPIDWTALPQPTGFVAATAGDTWRFQAWYRDANPGVTSNFTDALAITVTN